MQLALLVGSVNLWFRRFRLLQLLQTTYIGLQEIPVRLLEFVHVLGMNLKKYKFFVTSGRELSSFLRTTLWTNDYVQQWKSFWSAATLELGKGIPSESVGKACLS